MAGVVGFEPTDDGVRVRCLTAWRYPYPLYSTKDILWRKLAPRVGLEPTTDRLTADCSTN